MCDYSLQHAKSRPANVADRLITTNFGMGTCGFADLADAEISKTAICVLPGTEIAFDDPIRSWTIQSEDPESTVAIFRQIDKDTPNTHHDCLELPSGMVVKLTTLSAGQRATVLQLPAAPKTEAEVKEQTRAEYTA